MHSPLKGSSGIDFCTCRDQPYPADEQAMRRDNWYRDDWVNRQQDQWAARQDNIYPPQQPPHAQPPQAYQQEARPPQQMRHMRTPSPERSQPWDPNIGYPHTVDTTTYYPAEPQPNTEASGAGQRNNARFGLGFFGNASLDRRTRGLNHYLTETGRNLSQPTLAINRLVGTYFQCLNMKIAFTFWVNL